MKPLFLISLSALCIALFLPLFLVTPTDTTPEPSSSPELPPPADSSAPSVQSSSSLKDSELLLTCQMDGELREVSMADYLPGVLAAEMPASFEPEALKAQAVAARSYILRRAMAPPSAHPEAAVCGDYSCCLAHVTEQSLRESWGARYAEYNEKIHRAVSETDGQFLTYDGIPAQAVFHASSSGRTEDSGAIWSPLPYLVSVESPETAENVPHYITTVEVSPSDLRSTLEAVLPDAAWGDDPSGWLGPCQYDSSGRVESISIGGENIAGTSLRSLFGLRSVSFTLEYTDGRFLFTVTGSGHGVGMSQYGANVMASEGADYAEILAHYYPGTVLSKP
ncbi:MAG: stage II sporulation protein D [Eubacteriales bacterium]|nr:stage II sporulation protein D [Eubacteriales bacterium]